MTWPLRQSTRNSNSNRPKCQHLTHCADCAHLPELRVCAPKPPAQDENCQSHGFRRNSCCITQIGFLTARKLESSRNPNSREPRFLPPQVRQLRFLPLFPVTLERSIAYMDRPAEMHWAGCPLAHLPTALSHPATETLGEGTRTRFRASVIRQPGRNAGQPCAPVAQNPASDLGFLMV